MNRKIAFIYYDLEGNMAMEELSSKKITSNIYELKEIPLCAYNISKNDIFSVESEGGELFFDSLIKKSGNTTIQIVILKNEISNLLLKIERIGADIRWFNEGYFAINIPLFDDYLVLKKGLDDYEKKNIISYREACLGSK